MKATLEGLLVETVVILAAAIVVLLISRRLRIPPVVGYLLTGVLIGPSGLGLVPDSERVELFAEIGVVLLLFSIGLEFSPSRLRELRRPFLIGGSIQVVLAGAAGTLGSLFLGFGTAVAIFLGCVVALSSTAIVLKLYTDRKEIGSPQGRQSVGILLFQDFMLVPMIAMVPVLAGEVSASPQALVGRFVAAIAILGVVFVAGRYLLPPLLHELVRTRVREVILLSSLLICLALALLTEHFDFSLALGAFLAGILLSESEYSAQVVADVGPLRDLFTSFFFVSIGMLPSLGFLAGHLPEVLSLTVAIVVFKGLAAGLAALATGSTRRTAIIAGASLAQIGEFSFVLLKLGRDHGLATGGLLEVLVASSVLSMLLTPVLLALASTWTLSDRADPEAGLGESDVGPLAHVVVAGYGTGGRHLTHVLKEAGIPYVVVDANSEIVRGAARDDEPILFGDATLPEILHRAGVGRARVLVIALSDELAARRTASIARRLQPSIHIVARTRAIDQIDELRQAGTDEVIAEEFETSIELLTRVLHRYHVPRNIIRAQTRALRGESYKMLRVSPLDATLGERLVDLLAAGTADVFHLSPDSPAVGRTLKDLHLRAETGATVLAIVRGEHPHTNPPSEFELREGDELVLVGGHAEIESAFRLLEGRMDLDATES